MKKWILSVALIALSAPAFAKGKKIASLPMKRGQRTIVCGKAGYTITNALSNIKGELSKPKVNSSIAQGLTVNRPFTATPPIVHSEKLKKKKNQQAEVYVACVTVKKS